MSTSHTEAAAAGSGVYRSCHWIEGGLLVGEQVKICCVGNLMNHSTAALRTLANLGDGDVPLQRVFEVKDQLRIANQGPQAPCEGCHLLREQPWAARREGFDFVAFGGYMHCNLACSFCVSSKLKPGERLPGSLLAVLDQLIEAGALAAPARIDLGGGEPTLYHEFQPMIERCLAHRLTAMVFTNATGYVEPLAEGLRRGLFEIVTSVDAGTRETYLRLKTRDFFDRVWVNLAHYAAANPAAVTAKYILVRGNLSREDLAGFVGRCKDAGIAQIAIAKNVYGIVDAANTTPSDILDAAVVLAALARAQGIAWRASTELSDADRRHVEARLASGGEDLPRYQVARSDDAYPEFLFTGDPGFARRLQFALTSGVRTVAATLYYPATLDELPDQVVQWLKAVRRSGGQVALGDAAAIPGETGPAAAWHALAAEGRVGMSSYEQHGDPPLRGVTPCRPSPDSPNHEDPRLRRLLKRKIRVDPEQAVEAMKDFDAAIAVEPASGRVLKISFTRRDPARRQPRPSWAVRWLGRIQDAIRPPTNRRTGPTDADTPAAA